MWNIEGHCAEKFDLAPCLKWRYSSAGCWSRAGSSGKTSAKIRADDDIF
jgi:hypothetical protein